VKLPFLWINGTLYRKGQNNEVVSVLPRQVIQDALEQAHDSKIGGHFGVEKTLDKLKSIGWWSTIKEDTEMWIKHCKGCQRMKIGTLSTAAPMKPIVATYLGEIWAADIAVLSTCTKGNRHLFVMSEYLSKWVITAALASFDTDHIIPIILFEVCLKLGVPNRLITDNGSNFISEAMNQVCTRLGIRRSLTAVEHPQTDGLVERLNRTIKTSLAICADNNPFEWDEHLPFVTFAYNTAKQSSTGYSPFEVMFGRKAKLPLVPDDPTIPRRTYETEEWAAYLNNHLPLVHGQAMKNIEKAQTRQKRAYNKGKRVKYDYKIGDLIKRKNLAKSGFPKERWDGPWVITERISAEGNTFRISKDVNGKTTTSTANCKHMLPYYPEAERSRLLKEGMM
jgi:transposase InsO family protein